MHLIEVIWKMILIFLLKNHIFLGYESHMIKYFFSVTASTLSGYWDWFNLIESFKVSAQNLPKYKMRWSRSSKTYQAANFLEGAYQCQTDVAQVAGVLFGETAQSAPWHPSVKPPIVPADWQRSYIFLAQKIPFLHRLARLTLTLGSYSFTRCMNVSLLRSRTLALLCQTVQGALQRR